MKVLIIDDTKSVHAFIESLLKKAAGIEITRAMNGAEAMETLASGKAFDLIFLDWEMPVMNGPETLKHLKARQVPFPVIMMTTKNAPEDIMQMLEAGASEYMMKPFTVDILFEKIHLVTGKQIPYAA